MSSDVGHVTIGFPVGHFLLVVLRNGVYLQPFSRYSMANVTQWFTWH